LSLGGGASLVAIDPCEQELPLRHRALVSLGGGPSNQLPNDELGLTSEQPVTDVQTVLASNRGRTARLSPNPPIVADLVAAYAKVPGKPVLTDDERRRASLSILHN
jgi:hypothetical protein